ncbi:hypothetical protein ACWGRL_05360 [[Kitasatospora] papulosa]
MSPTPTNPTTAPIDCAEPGCTWAVRGVPDKYARIMARDHAAEHAGQASSTATETAVDRVPLRDRIRRAVCEAEGFAWDTDMLEPDEYGEVADAVLAVLPAPAVDRATVLREAANGLAALGPLDSLVSAPDAWTEAIETLRRMADQIAEDDRSRLAAEAQQPTPAETEETVAACKCGHPQERHVLLSGTYAQCRHKYPEAGRPKCRCGMYRPQSDAPAP